MAARSQKQSFGQSLGDVRTSSLKRGQGPWRWAKLGYVPLGRDRSSLATIQSSACPSQPEQSEASVGVGAKGGGGGVWTRSAVNRLPVLVLVRDMGHVFEGQDGKTINSKKEWEGPSTPEFGMKTQVPAGFVCAMDCGGLRLVTAVDVGEVIDIYMRHRLGNKGDSLRIVTRSGIGRSGALCTCSNTGPQPPLPLAGE